MTERKTILITGATGQQGGAIAARGIAVVQGDLDDPASTEKSLAGAWGAYAVQNTREAGVEGEEEQGKRFATLAKRPAAAAALSQGLGRRITYGAIPIEEVRKNSEDVALMLEWFERGGYDVDIPALEREYGIPATPFAAWAAQQRAG